MENEEIWVMERSGSGYRIRKTTRTQEFIKDMAAITVVIAGLIAAIIILL